MSHHQLVVHIIESTLNHETQDTMAAPKFFSTSMLYLHSSLCLYHSCERKPNKVRKTIRCFIIHAIKRCTKMTSMCFTYIYSFLYASSVCFISFVQLMILKLNDKFFDKFRIGFVLRIH